MRLNLRGEPWIRSRRKRFLDLCLCASVFPIAATTAVFSYIAIKIEQQHRAEQRNSPLFGQVRVGRGGKTFVIHKFYTMPVGWERVSTLGEFLAVLGADETPQLVYTIWTGRMATIGPRPLVLKDFETMRTVLGAQKYAEWHHAYTLCRPGWMGAFSTPSRSYVPQSREYLYARYLYDTSYIRHASARVDVVIFLRSLTMWCADLARLWHATTAVIMLPFSRRLAP